MKFCKGCHQEKAQTEFHKNQSRCKNCRRKSNREWQRKNKEHVLERNKKWRSQNLDKANESVKRWQKANPEKRREIARNWGRNNRDKTREYQRRKRASDPIYRIKNSLRERVRRAVLGHSKSSSTMKLLGCSIEYLKKHLENQFTEGMSWDNYGKWHIDHIRPCASFDLSDPEQQKECFHYSNLQPLWAKDNISKGAKLSR